jgi:hypothetical protein
VVRVAATPGVTLGTSGPLTPNEQYTRQKIAKRLRKMSSSSFTCLKPSDLDKVTKAAAAYRKMSDVKVVTRAASQAGERLKTAMQTTIKGESTLSQYHDVSEALQVYQEAGNVQVGLPDSHPLYGRACDMENVFPVADVVMDLSRQQGDTEAAFYDALAEMVSQ